VSRSSDDLDVTGRRDGIRVCLSMGRRDHPVMPPPDHDGWRSDAVKPLPRLPTIEIGGLNPISEANLSIW
jgi:hypothetical protein